MGTATIDGRLLAKFAFSEPTAVRLWHEARLLELLGGQAFDVPEVVAASPSPAFLATRIVDGGVPLSYELVRASMPDRVDAIGAELARFLANLHAGDILALARERLDDPLRIPEPGLQATTDELRSRFTPMIAAPQRARVNRWCDWVDEQLAAPADVAFVHGDFHPYNQLWDARELRLLLVADFETSGVAEPEYDFRALPSFGPGVTRSALAPRSRPDTNPGLETTDERPSRISPPATRAGPVLPAISVEFPAFRAKRDATPRGSRCAAEPKRDS
jgi:ketosteroid isomerase-like protein